MEADTLLAEDEGFPVALRVEEVGVGHERRRKPHHEEAVHLERCVSEGTRRVRARKLVFVTIPV